jgi:predicted transcriptional regulator
MPNNPNPRSQYDLSADILTVALEGALSTKIQAYANISFRQWQEYSAKLVEAGLLERHSKAYFATALGRKYLEAYATLAKISGQHGRIAPVGHHDKKEKG